MLARVKLLIFIYFCKEEYYRLGLILLMSFETQQKREIVVQRYLVCRCFKISIGVFSTRKCVFLFMHKFKKKRYGMFKIALYVLTILQYDLPILKIVL